MTSAPILKICGMTRVGDALHAVREGATAIGFVFWKGSPRYIEPERAGEIAAALPATVTTVGVFVNEPVDAIRETARVAGLRMVQLHGEETPAYMEQIGQPVMRAVTLDTMVETTKTWRARMTRCFASPDLSPRGAGHGPVDRPRAAVITRGRR